MIRLVRLLYLHFMHANVSCCHCFKDKCNEQSYSLLMHMGLGLYWVIQAGLLTPLTFARHRLSP